MSMQTVLNVDDTSANRYVKSRALRCAGFKVIEAGTGRTALALTLEHSPDVVLLDLKLPDISGFDVCRILKSDPKTRHIPVVHISATFVDDQTKRDSAEAGAEIYLAEPVAPDELTSTVRTVLRLRATERELAERETRLRLATESAGIATWDLSPESGSATWSARFYRLLGLDPETTHASREAWLARVPLGERETLAATLDAAVREQGSIALEHWIERAGDGEARCLAVFGTMQADEGRRASRLIGVAMDVTERKKAEAEREALLEQARAAQRLAEDAARTKDEFLAILSHELRTPMAAVLGWLHLARTAGLAPEEHARALAIAERNAKLQVQLVNDLLDVSRIITGKLELEAEPLALDDVLTAAVESARVAADERSVSLSLDLGPGPWSVRGSASRLAQVFGNLLSNAIRFSPLQARVEVHARSDGERAIVTVRDAGEGISPELLPHVFETFRQAEDSMRRRHGGLGLGLAIVKSLTELHGGQVSAQSDGIGKGARFVVTLPLAAGAQAPAEPAAATAAESTLQGARILVVEDHPDHRELVARLLGSYGAEVRTAAGAGEALALVERWRPETMVLDIAMPEVDGYQLLARLRARLRASAEALPALALTGFASHSDAARSLGAGFQAHLAKPFESKSLIGLLAHMISSGRAAPRDA